MKDCQKKVEYDFGLLSMTLRIDEKGGDWIISSLKGVS